MTALICHTRDVATYEPSEKLQAALTAVRRTEAAHAEAMEQLRLAVIGEVAKPSRPADVARYVGWHPGHVRRLARNADVAPYVDREPPRRS